MHRPGWLLGPENKAKLGGFIRTDKSMQVDVKESSLAPELLWGAGKL